MDKAREKAQATRARNQEIQAALWKEKAESVRAARKALQRVLESTEATPEQILEAARLLVDIGK